MEDVEIQDEKKAGGEDIFEDAAETEGNKQDAEKLKEEKETQERPF